MKVKHLFLIALTAAFYGVATHAMALEDGLYKAIDRKGTCSSNADVTIYVEGDRPINLSLNPGGTGMMQDPQKITASKTPMIMRGESSVFKMEFWKAKANQFYVKVIGGSDCDGLQMTFAKSN